MNTILTLIILAKALALSFIGKCYINLNKFLSASALTLGLIESMVGLRPRQGNLRLVFRLLSFMRGLPSIRLK